MQAIHNRQTTTNFINILCYSRCFGWLPNLLFQYFYFFYILCLCIQLLSFFCSSPLLYLWMYDIINMSSENARHTYVPLSVQHAKKLCHFEKLMAFVQLCIFEKSYITLNMRMSMFFLKKPHSTGTLIYLNIAFIQKIIKNGAQGTKKQLYKTFPIQTFSVWNVKNNEWLMFPLHFVRNIANIILFSFSSCMYIVMHMSHV